MNASHYYSTSTTTTERERNLHERNQVTRTTYTIIRQRQRRDRRAILQVSRKKNGLRETQDRTSALAGQAFHNDRATTC